MKRAELQQMSLYLAAALASVTVAFLISMKWLGSLKAQEGAPPPANLQAPGMPPGVEQVPVDRGAVQSAAQAAGLTDQAPPSSDSSSNLAELEGFLEPFIYDMVNRRDPFLAYAEFIPVEGEGPARALTPAQRFALEELRLVGVMWDVRDPKAMFMDPDEEVLVLGRDESIGNRNGYIAAIREGEVVVVEAIRKRGDIIYRTRVLRIER